MDKCTTRFIRRLKHDTITGNMKNNCGICNRDIGILTRHKVADGFICNNCLIDAKYATSDLGKLKTKTIKDVVRDIARKNANLALLDSFDPTKKIGRFIYFDEPKKQWILPKGMFGSIKNSWVYSFSDIREYELLENGGSVSSGGLGRALVGGVLFGGIGAVVGGVTGKKRGVSTVTSMQVKITTNDMNNPAVYIDFIKGGASFKTNSMTYRAFFKNAQDVMSTLSVIANGEKQLDIIDASGSPIAQLREYKQLLDDSIITQAEFDKKKQELLA